MRDADNRAGPGGQWRGSGGPGLPRHAELVIIGGGIMGLWAAVKAERLGIATVLIDAGRFGKGASGGLLGALMPFAPDRWDAKKEFQLQALVGLEDEIARLEAETGMDCGYRRCGRLIPLPRPHLRRIAKAQEPDAAAHWRVGRRRFDWQVIDTSPYAGWPDGGFTEAGLVQETLAARLSPRRLIAALLASLAGARHVQMLEGLEVRRIDTAMRRVVFSNSDSLGYGHVFVAAGQGSFALLEAISPLLQKPLGRAVKGQAALLAADLNPALPVLFLNGLYIVVHDGGHVAVGSTSEDVFDDPRATDARLDDLIAEARLLVPALKEARVVERWAGLRPKAIERDPMIGPHPDHADVIALTGGFKVSFGLAHRLADAALALMQGKAAMFPPSFATGNHLRAAG